MRKFVVHVILGLVNQYTIKQSVMWLSLIYSYIYLYIHEFRKVLGIGNFFVITLISYNS